MQARLKFKDDKEKARAQTMIEGEVDRVFHTRDMARGNLTFVATGITSGDLLKGVRFKRNYAQTESIIMRSNGIIRRIETIHKDATNGPQA